MSAPIHAIDTRDQYTKLLAMTFIAFLAMYALMYAIVDRWENVYRNINQIFIAGLMVAPMVLIELVVMRDMYPDRQRNVIVAVAAATVMALCWFGIREQSGVSYRQFIRSMIPHHAGAILMCEKNGLEDPELQRLCSEIITSQRAEIEQMKALLQKLAK